MGTRSDGGRVRYIGIFQDPNELACVTSISLPFVFMWLGEKKSASRRLLARLTPLPVLVASILCNIMTQSRSGQISLIATLGVYFVRRFGMRGMAVGGVLAIPVLLFGGRSDESSTEERLECWSEALSMWREHPVLGIGAKQFGQHYYLTAHNSALLALSELGPLGLLLWTIALYVAFKTTLQIQRDFANRPEAADVRAAAFATLAGLVGMVASALFLSLTYHLAFWIEVGLVSSIQGLVWRHDPDWKLRWRWRDLFVVIGLDVGAVASIAIYLRSKGI
jgi:O-antigen ligase